MLSLKRILGLAALSLLLLPSKALAVDWQHISFAHTVEKEQDEYHHDPPTFFPDTYIDLDSVVLNQPIAFYWRLDIKNPRSDSPAAIKTYEQLNCSNGTVIIKKEIQYNSRGQVIDSKDYESMNNNVVHSFYSSDGSVMSFFCSKKNNEPDPSNYR